MLSPIRNNAGQAPVVRGASTPAPVGGWNARDSLADMPPEDAVTLENWFPDTDKVGIRKGYMEHVAGLTGAVETLMPYSPPGGTVKLFACANAGVHDVTNSTATAASASLTSLSSIRMQHTNFGTSGGNFLYWVNGEDAARYYDGSAWSTPALSGVSSAVLAHVNVFKRRLFFVEKNSLSFWYLPVESIAGTVAEFRLDGLCQLGGYLQAMGTWTLDAGDGLDDYAVFVTSEGEVIVYQGTDPSSANTWTMVGVFRIGKPIGRRCMMKVGPELIIITQDGILPMSVGIGAARSNQRAAVSDKIRGAVSRAASQAASRFGWQPVFYPEGNKIIFNVPTNTGKFEQYVSNSTTGAWCKFTGLNASCWAVHNGGLYFGGSGAVYQAETGQNDNGSDIVATAKPAFAYFGSRGSQKRWTMVRPVVQSEGDINLALSLNVDYGDSEPSSTPTYSGSSGSAWDVSPWDTSPWGGASTPKSEWQSVAGVGHAATVKMKAAVNGLSLDWYATDWTYEAGGFL